MADEPETPDPLKEGLEAIQQLAAGLPFLRSSNAVLPSSMPIVRYSPAGGSTKDNSLREDIADAIKRSEQSAERQSVAAPEESDWEKDYMQSPSPGEPKVPSRGRQTVDPPPKNSHSVAVSQDRNASPQRRPPESEAPKPSLEELVQKAMVGNDSDTAADSSERNYGTAIAIYVGLLVTGLLLVAEHEPFSTSWWYGAVYTLGGAVGAMSVTPLFRERFPAIIQLLRAPRSLWVAATVTWLLLALNAGLAIYDRLGPSTRMEVAASHEKIWQPLSDDEAISLRIDLKNIAKRDGLRIVCTRSDCRELAGNLMSVFHEVGWNPIAIFDGSYSQPVGVVLYQNDINDRSLADAIERATEGDCSLKSDLLTSNQLKRYLSD